MELYGHTVIKKNGVVVFDKHNLIRPPIRGYLANSLGGETNAIGDFADPPHAAGNSRAIQGASLFSEADTAGTFSTVLAKHGIGISDNTVAAGSIRPMETTVATEADNEFGAKWLGKFVASAPVQFRTAWLGWQSNDDGTALPFDVTYAFQSFPTQALATNDVLNIEWELYIA